ncbi:MAG: sugar kinase [Hyphomonadaceae bacterium]|nr:sugar kinase [Hyphomonadaceae bacterium]
MGRLLCFGEMLVRLTAPAGEMLLQTPQLSAHIGGAEANVAICVSRLGGDAAMATILPDNPLGRAARDELRRHGVDASNVKFGPGRMGLYFLTPGAVTRAPEITYDRTGSAIATAPANSIDWASALKGAEWLHISGITPAISKTAGEATLAAVKAARAANVKVCFDGNYRSKLWEARGETGQAILKQLLEHATLAFIDERDIALVLGVAGADRSTAAKAAFAAFPKLDMIAATTRETHGVNDYSLGATLFARAGSQQCPAIALPGVVDRIGAGDAFAGGFLYALMTGVPEAKALAFALHSAAAKHGQVGDASHASEADILALMAGGGFDVKR